MALKPKETKITFYLNKKIFSGKFKVLYKNFNIDCILLVKEVNNISQGLLKRNTKD